MQIFSFVRKRATNTVLGSKGTADSQDQNKDVLHEIYR